MKRKFKMKFFGLSEGEALELLKKYGENKVERKKKISAWKIFFSQFKSPLILLLVLASLVSLAVNYYQKEEFLDTFLILTIVFISALLGFFKSIRLKELLKACKNLHAPKAKLLEKKKKKK